MSRKTTLSSNVASTLNKEHGLKCIAFSSDDLYLPFVEQLKVAQVNAGNKLLEYRGNAGTVDAALGREILLKLKGETEKLGGDNNSGNQEGGNLIEIPRYDKGLNQGRGDRAPKDQWIKVETGTGGAGVSTDVDVVLFEGWNMGFLPVSDSAVEKIFADNHKAKQTSKNKSENKQVNENEGGNEDGDETASEIENPYHYTLQHKLQDIKTINNNLKQHQQKWYGLFDLFVYIRTDNLNNIYEWRIEQEKQLLKQKDSTNRGAMTDDQVQEFVARFMPCYEVNGTELSRVGRVTGPENAHHPPPILTLVFDKFRDLVASSTA
ncbi:D-glycerate 3-kinase, chloroplastic [Zancudomyces culisetae]|uniref:D-glycerate 3-kinase, chloroplastic n=1 Tax=Zancudomyces culisetae TaxID=1213189 RepID=A0A1R1PXS0_ZANCU|nr:D-glycerate 3-kinase, chloroplastic [Zancudomyces culisetae]|eukprot:OMH85729.1 D-glycerate 3-kinase, chloroplastic [Zancudomyces culisetae]